MKKALLPLLGIAALFIFQSCTSKQGESKKARFLKKLSSGCTGIFKGSELELTGSSFPG